MKFVSKLLKKGVSNSYKNGTQQKEVGDEIRLKVEFNPLMQ